MLQGQFIQTARKISRSAVDLPSVYEAFGLLDEAYLQAEPSEQTDQTYSKIYKSLDKKLAQFEGLAD